MSYSDLQLTTMATTQPLKLVQILNSPNADIQVLVSGAEILGAELKDEELVLPTLKKLLSHINVLVREASIIGIIEFYTTKQPPTDILDKLTYISKFDPSAALREYADDAIKNFDK